jgi:ABC-type glutathione transport system ATPase component
MHLNFGVINDKVSNILAIDNSNYAIAISYAKCDFESDNQNNSSINVSDPKDIDCKESIINSKDEINRNLNLSFDYVVHENDILSGNEEKLCIAVQVHNLCFSYPKLLMRNQKSNEILQNCSINVVEGSIYALLGSSGCGKTTLLKCILGRLKPNSGDINVFGFKPNAPNSTIPGILKVIFRKFSK